MIPHPLQGTPFGDMLDLCILLAFLAWLFSVLTKEYSWVDRLWSTAPIIYVGYVAYAADFQNMRLNVMAVLVAMWGFRLTFNFWRKGGFAKGGEDYRWEILQERLGPTKFQLLNATFVAPYQMFLIWLFTSPVHAAWEHQTAFHTVDLFAAVLFLVFLLGETIADEQMWRFQEDKRQKREQHIHVDPPFFCGGLYRFSRHPNYFCELGQWWVFYLFAVGATNHWVHWSGSGFILLTLLFHGSVQFGESISAGKYPGYTEYQNKVSRIIPFLKGVYPKTSS